MIEAKTRAWWRATAALCLGSFLVFINLYVPQPLLPALKTTFEVSTLGVSLLMSAATLSLAFALLIFGPLSDAIGRETIMRVTLVAAGALSLLLAAAPNFETLLLLRLIQGFVLGGLPAVAIAWMGDEFDKPALLSAVGLYIGANSLGGISGRVVGGFAATLGGEAAAFLTVGTMTLLGCLLFWRLLPNSKAFVPKPFELRQALRDLAGHLRTPVLLAAYVLGGLNFLIFINQYSYITFRLAAPPYQLAAGALGLIFLTYLGGTFGSTVSGRLAQRFSPARCMGAGILILMLGTGVTLLSPLWLVMLGLLINAFGFFLCHSLASGWVGRYAQGARGSASALYLVFYYLGASVGGFWLEPFWRWAQWSGVAVGSWLLLGVTFFIALGLYRFERRENQR
ncbi:MULTISPECIES: MFS transporter [unclassified Halomonas]|uniref:MFS transporter n=1 Tax=unclassified Halomonas TaxID=2609666 RepID=UPI0021E47139|nr:MULTISPECIES: MFS transporter [unclassified Halomonas]UYG00957.1 MFS transporter [Halomonas sp. GD1P12]WNL41303.1 MFS transporter [Halomonas sp. PAMB 3264]